MIGQGRKYEAQSSQSFRCNQAAGGHGPARSAVRHLSACHSARCIALGCDSRRSGALHAGRRSRSLTILLRDASHYHSRRPEDIWPWLVQIGYGRAGFYGYDLIENLGSSTGVRSAGSILPELQHPRPATCSLLVRLPPLSSDRSNLSLFGLERSCHPH